MLNYDSCLMKATTIKTISKHREQESSWMIKGGKQSRSNLDCQLLLTIVNMDSYCPTK